MTTDKFDEIKSEILNRAKEHHACTQQYGRAYNAKGLAELLQVVKDNFWWACRNNVLRPDLIEHYREDFSANGIYLNVDVEGGYLLCGNITVKACGNATVKACDNATVEACDNATVKAYDNATVKACDNATVKAYDNATVEAYDNATVKACDNATVEAYGNATVKACDNAYCTSLYTIECKLADNAIYRLRGSNTVFYANDHITFKKQQ